MEYVHTPQIKKKKRSSVVIAVAQVTYVAQVQSLAQELPYVNIYIYFPLFILQTLYFILFYLILMQ